MRELKPSDFAKVQPMNSVKQKSESETIARNIMHILTIGGDTWRVLPIEEYTKIRKSHGGWSPGENRYFNEVVGYCKSPDTAVLFSPMWKEVEQNAK